MTAAEMVESNGVFGTTWTKRPERKRRSEAIARSHRAMDAYRWVRYATTPSGPARSIRTKPTRSN